ncbi:RICIN domain-containing protein [Streptomyces avidinii]|uniref:RICIN domain-containing protein n=1 Tax=Streptomyces avidinii TaxID=1895 RepID=UPI00386DE235|nr:RICIN domain-containing protein [Streptomyces avidinii]
MGKAGRPQGESKGATDEANALARFLRTMTDSLTVRELAERYGGGKTLWGEYRCGARIIPLGRLNTVVRDRVRDPRGRGAMLEGPPALPDGLFRLTNTGSRMCLSADRGSTVPSGGLVQTGCGANSDQFWKLTAEATGPEGTVYALRNLHSGLCLSVDAARTADDALVTQYLCGDESGLFPDRFWAFRYNAPHRA